MKVKEFIKKLKEFNPEADIDVVIKSTPFEELEFYYGTSEGCTKKNCECVSINVAAFDNPETPEII